MISTERVKNIALAGIIATTASMATSAMAETSAADKQSLRQQSKAMFGTLPDTMPGSDNDTAILIELGEKLYMDPRLSVNDTQSCNSCHLIGSDKTGTGVDNLATSPGAIKGKGGDRNSPTVWNAGFQVTQFWDGRAKDLKAQAKGPILNPVEMAMPSEQAVEEKIGGIEEYQVAFKQAFGSEDSVTYDNLAHAIAAFERTLISQDRFDEFMNGDDKALNDQELAGLQTFISTGCVACHSGKTLGGHMYQKLGMVNAYPHQEDLGRHKVTGNEADKMVFKVPMLRDISRAAPYFHDGSIETLDQAIKDMAWYQLGRKLDQQQVDDIAAFLKALDHQPTSL